MADLVLPKAIALFLLIVVGYLLKGKFSDSASVTTFRVFILTVALPATIFLSTIDINTQLNLWLLPSFALGVNLSLMLAGTGLTWLLLRSLKSPKARALILLFPSLAPGLTVYPFIEQFLGRSGLAWVALADMGNKIFVLIGLYALAIYWFQQEAILPNTRPTAQWKTIGQFLFTEPVNAAIVVGLVLASLHIGTADLPLAVLDVLQKLALCSTPLILFYVGVSLNLKKLQFGTLLLALLARAGVGFLISAAAMTTLRPSSVEEIALFTALPQASCSLWPLLHATKINQQNQAESTVPFFDLDFATALLALSFPFSISMLLMIFTGGTFFYDPFHLTAIGTGFIILFLVLLITKNILKARYGSLPRILLARRVDP